LIRIGFDAKRAFQNHTGLGVYSRNLIHEVASNNAFELFLYTPKVKITFLPESNRIHCIQPPFYLKGILSSIWRSFFILYSIYSSKLDIYHGLSGELPFGIGLFKKTKKIVTIHDILFKRFPNDYPILDRFFYVLKTSYAIHHADQIIAVSKATKDDLIAFYNIDAHKIIVIENTINPNYYQTVNSSKLIDLPNKFICQIATFLPRKNQRLTIESFIQIADQVDLDLVMIGTGKNFYKECLLLAKASTYSHRIHFIDRVSPSQLISVYQKASMNIYPSLYEGFGIPILEAMACQCPNIISNALPLLEVAGGAALAFDLSVKNDLADKILELYRDEKTRKNLIEKGSLQIQNYLPEKIYPKLFHCYYTQDLNNMN